MKEAELREHAVCSLCHEKIMKDGMPLFWKVTLERFALEHDAMMRQSGLAFFLGGSDTLAAVVGPDEDMATQIMAPVVLTVCEKCAAERNVTIYELVFPMTERRRKGS